MSKRKDRDIVVPPVLQKLARLSTEGLRALLRTVPGVNLAALDRAGDAAMRDAFKTYWRTGKLTEQAIFNFTNEDGKA